MSENYNKSVAVEEELQKIQSLEQKCLSKSRFRRLTFHLEPLIDFLLMYSPAVDIIVQFDANPSAVIWGSLKAIIKASLNASANIGVPMAQSAIADCPEFHQILRLH